MEHSLWLSLMHDRLKILRTLLSEDGSLWVRISDHEQAYLEVLLDEVFGRSSFPASIVWERTTRARSQPMSGPTSILPSLIRRRVKRFGLDVNACGRTGRTNTRVTYEKLCCGGERLRTTVFRSSSAFEAMRLLSEYRELLGAPMRSAKHATHERRCKSSFPRTHLLRRSWTR